MLVEEGKLRWFGIDMRSRRRVAVVATYAIYLVVVWVPSSKVFSAMMAMYFVWLLSFIGQPLEDAVSLWVRRMVKAAFLIPMAGVAVIFWRHPANNGSVAADLYGFTLLLLGSVLGWSKLVDSGAHGWRAEAIRHSGKLGWWKRRALARAGFAVGLDGFAWYEYGVRFKKLTEEQKAEIEELDRSNPQGKWMRRRAHALFDDERMRHEEDRLRARVQRVMTWVLVASALAFGVVQAEEKAVSTAVVVGYAWTLAALVTTLRQAIPLWTEDDPRVVSGEMRLVNGD